MKDIFQQFAEKWELHEEIVEIIYHWIDENGVKYSKTSKILLHFKIVICPRQLKYFYRKVKLTDRYGNKENIGARNYCKLVISKC